MLLQFQEERDLFAKSDRWQYMEKDYKVFDDEKIVIFGATLWSDFKVGSHDSGWGMILAKQTMNDFRLGLMRDENNEIVGLKPQWCLEEHKKIFRSCTYSTSRCRYWSFSCGGKRFT